MASYYGFNLNFLMAKGVEHLFMALLAVHTAFLYRSHSNFCTYLLVFVLILSCKNLSGYKFFAKCMDCKYILPVET